MELIVKSLLVLSLFITQLKCQENPDKSDFSACTRDWECEEKREYCDRSVKKCICDGSFVLEDGKCLANVSFQGECLYSLECHKVVPNALCLNSKCECKNDSYYHSTDKTCYKISKYNDKCDVKQNCILDPLNPDNSSMVCIGGFCTCPVGFKSNDDGLTCIKAVKYKEECEFSEQCDKSHHPSIECIKSENSSICHCPKPSDCEIKYPTVIPPKGSAAIALPSGLMLLFAALVF